MENRIDIDNLPEFDASQYLDSEEAIALYLSEAMKTQHAGHIADVLGDIARARGMTEIAKIAGISRTALYEALRPGTELQLDTMRRVCAALGGEPATQSRRAA